MNKVCVQNSTLTEVIQWSLTPVYNELIKQPFLVYIFFFFFPVRTNTFRILWPRCSLGEGPMPAHFEDCSLATRRKPGLSDHKDNDCQHNRDDKAQRAEHMPGNESFLHMWPLPSRVPAVPFLDFPHEPLQELTHNDLHLKQTIFQLWIRTAVTKS